MINFLFAIRYFIDALFCYEMYANGNRYRRFVTRKVNLQKTFIFCGFYTFVLMSYKLLVFDHPSNRFISAFMIFAYFWFESKKLNEWKFLLTFSVIISLLTESFHIISYAITFFSIQSIGITESIMSRNLVLHTSIVLVLHFFFLLLIYKNKNKFVSIRTIKELSLQNQIPALFTLCLLTILYFKYQIKQTPIESSETVMILCVMLSLVLPTYLGFYLVMGKLAELKNIKQNDTESNKIMTLVENAIASKMIYMSPCGHKPCAAKFYRDKILITNRLAELGIDNTQKGFSQLVFCLIITKNLIGLQNWSFEKDVFSKASRFTHVKPAKIHDNIDDIIKRVWLLDDSHSAVVKEFEEDAILTKELPSVEEFLVETVKSAA